MSDGFSSSGGSNDETLEVEMDWLPSHALAELGAPAMVSSYGVEAHQARHGDMQFAPAAHGTFNDENGQMDLDEMHAWIAREKTETPHGHEDEEEADKPALQGWTYLADYSFHPLTPNHSGPRNYYIHARIRHDNRLEFGVFASRHKGEFESNYALARLSRLTSDGETLPARAQVLHGNLRTTLRIAGKSESEQMMMKNGKLILAACPRLLGVLMNTGMGKLAVTYGETTTYRSITYYGHIWTYWGTIVDNTLYFVGLPLYTGSDKGAYKCSIGGETRTYRVSLPPTIHDVRAGSGSFMAAAKLLWGHRSGAGFERTTPMAEPVLRKYGDWETPAVLCRRALARISPTLQDDEYELEQLVHGDMGDSLTLYSIYGGAYASKDGISLFNGDKVSHVHFGSGSTFRTSGASGFIPTKTRCSLDGRVRYMAQAIYVYQYGPSYQIRLMSPFHPYGYIPEPGDVGYKLLSQADARVAVPKEPDEEEEEDDNNNGGDDDNGGGNDGGDGDEEEEEDDGDGPSGNEPEDLGNCGIWLDGSDGISVSASREDKEGKIAYRFKISVSQTFTETETLYYTLALKCSVADGGSYSVDESTTVTMWYYLTGSIATITVCNITSKSWGGGSWNSNSHPSSVTTFEQTALRKATATGSFGGHELLSTGDVSKCNQSNIVQVVSSGGTREVTASLKYKDAEGKTRTKRVKASFTRYKLVLQKATIKQILKNTMRKQTAAVTCTVSPASITGTGGGSAGAPTVTNNGVTATAVPLPIQGESDVRGTFKMQVKGNLGTITASYNVTNGTTGWYEGTVDNRQSTSISGTFKVTAPAKSFSA